MLDLNTFIGEHKARTIDLFNLLVSDKDKMVATLSESLEEAKTNIELDKKESLALMNSIQERDKEIVKLVSE